MARPPVCRPAKHVYSQYGYAKSNDDDCEGETSLNKGADHIDDGGERFDDVSRPQNSAIELFGSIGKGIGEIGKNLERTFAGNESSDKSYSASPAVVKHNTQPPNPNAKFFDNVNKGFTGIFAGKK